MFKSFFKNNLTYNIGNIFTLGIAIFLLPIYTKYLSPNEFGIMDLFMVIGTFINLTIALEISQVWVILSGSKNTSKKRNTPLVLFGLLFSIFIIFFLSFLFSDTFSFFLLDDYGKKLIFY